ncbi:MAG: hypothetical protein IKQ37_01605 [Bacteroidaceae bacterium]|nr:hypothetical protein [Bacteroidaceae bacterium]
MKTTTSFVAMATAALVLGKNVNSDAAMCALRDMQGEFSTPLISMGAKPMPADIQELLSVKEVSTTGTKHIAKKVIA